MKDFYLLTTEHFERCLWFRDDSDFKVAMNYVAIQAACCPDVNVLAFILMSNHVHFVLYGYRVDVEWFITHFKGRYSQYYRNKHGVKAFLHNNKVDIRYVDYLDDSLRRAIAYVQMNCVAANICSHPSQYLWGTGNCFFAQSRQNGISLGELTERARERILRTNCNCLPQDWKLSEGGYIDPQQYVDIDTVEAVFRTPKRMNYFLASSSKARTRIEAPDVNLPTFRDQTILSALPELCKGLFHKDSFEKLSDDEKSEFAKQVRYRFNAEANQIARVFGISYSKAASLLDNI